MVKPLLQLYVQIELYKLPAEQDKYPFAGGTRTSHVTWRQNGCDPDQAWSASHDRSLLPTSE